MSLKNLPVLCFRSKAWTIRKQFINRMTACEIKLMQGTVGYINWDYRRSEDTLDKLKIKPVIDCVHSYQRK